MRRAARCDGRRWQVIRPRGGGWWRHVATARAASATATAAASATASAAARHGMDGAAGDRSDGHSRGHAAHALGGAADGDALSDGM